MSVLFSAALLGLAWFAALNAVASFGAWVAAPLLISSRRRSPAGLLALRLAPACASLLFVTLIFLPAHWRLEPRDAEESFGAILYLLALLAIVVLIRAGRRGWSVAVAARALHRCLRSTVATGERGVFELTGFPGVSLAGVFRPRVVIGTPARAALTPPELDVAVAHEQAHRRSRDNVKRCAMYCAPDLFGLTATADRLDRTWRAEAECRADLDATGGDESKAVHLAAALVKVARLGEPARSRLGSPVWSAFHDPALLEVRVRRLTDGQPGRPAASHRPSHSLIAALLAATLLTLLPGVPARVHHLTEAMIRLLP